VDCDPLKEVFLLLVQPQVVQLDLGCLRSVEQNRIESKILSNLRLTEVCMTTV